MKGTKQRIVVKVGTSTLTHESGSFNLRSMEHLVRTLADLNGMGHEVILVSSGAIAVGTAKMGLPERPKELRMKQAAAAVGQCQMMHIYDKFFSEYNHTVAQLLVTGADLSGEMLALAQKRARQSGVQAMFIQADMCALELPQRVDALVCACDGVNYLLDDARLNAFFRQSAS